MSEDGGRRLSGRIRAVVAAVAVAVGGLEARAQAPPPAGAGSPGGPAASPATAPSRPSAPYQPASGPPPTDGSTTDEPALPAAPSGPMGRVAGVLPLPLPGRASRGIPPPGQPGRSGRPRPGSIFDPGAAGPGISQSGTENFLDGALDPKTGWPFVFLDHFAPRPERVRNLWIVQTRACPQEMGSDPWPCLKVKHFNDDGSLVERPLAELLAQTIGRPVLIVVQGSLTTADAALGGLLWTHSWLQADGAILPETVVIAFDWPSQRIYRNDFKDINEKGRRAFIAGYHLARFVLAFPPESRICLLGQSYGGRVVPSALHLLGGGALDSESHDPAVALPGVRPDLHLRGIILAAASDHTWLDPGERFDRVLYASEAFLNLYNRRDEALRFYPALIRSDHHHALGKLGLKNSDFETLGPLAARYRESDVHDDLGREHTLLDATANRRIARLMAPYAWAPDPGPLPQRDMTEPDRYQGNLFTGRRRVK